jgi:hypothetical protein
VGNVENFLEKIKRNTREPTYSLWTGDTLNSNILDIEHSEIPQEHKCAHILELSNGNYAAQPNNRILWNIPSYTTDKSWPDYKVQNTIWEVEGSDWVTEDSDNMFYQIDKGTSS